MAQSREQQILGALLQDRTLIEKCDIDKSFFKTEKQRLIFNELQEGAADVNVVTQRIREKFPKFEDVFIYVTDCLEGVHRMTPAGLQQMINDVKKGRLNLEIETELKNKVKDHDKIRDIYQKIDDLNLSINVKRPQAETLKEFLARDIPKRQALIDPILGLQEMTMIHGRPKIGKSLLTLQLARCLITGSGWLGFKTHKLDRPILIIQIEIAPALMQDRARKVFGDIADSEKIIIPHQNRNIFFDQKAGRENVSCLVEDHKPGLVILDPYSRFFTDEETALKNPRPFFDFWQEQIEAYNLSLLFVHHDAKFQEGKLGGQKALGTTSINAATDGNWSIERILDTGLDPVEFLKTARLSFESRNWQNTRPLDLKLNDDLTFEVTVLPKGMVNEWDIVEEIEKAGGQIDQSKLIKQYSSVKMFYQAKNKAIDMNLIDEAKLENVRGKPVMLMLKKGVQ